VPLAVERLETILALAAPSRDKVRLTLSVSLSREQAERLTARAIHEGKNLKALVAEIQEAEPGGDIGAFLNAS